MIEKGFICDTVFLTGNLLDDDCLSSFEDYITFSQSIHTIGIGRNLTNEGVAKLADILRGNTKIRCVELVGNNSITDESISFFSEMANTTFITRVYLDNTKISFDVKNEILRLFQIPIDTRDIPIKSNAKSAAKNS